MTSGLDRVLAQARLAERDLRGSYEDSAVRRETVFVTMRDGVRLATDLYLPPVERGPAIVLRTPYNRRGFHEAALTLFARHGYVGVAQDCRGTGDSEPDEWHFYIYEADDGFDCVDWITRQSWFDGFIGSIGGSYDAATQYCMAMHPAMSAIAPEVGGLGVVLRNGPRLHMFLNAYARTVGKGEQVVAEQSDNVLLDLTQMEHAMLDETLATGYFSEPLHRPFGAALLNRYPKLASLPHHEAQRSLYEIFGELSPAGRIELIELALGKPGFDFVDTESLTNVLGHQIHPDSYLRPGPNLVERVQSIHAPALFLTGWYDWGLDDTLVTWELLVRHGQAHVRERSRLLISGSAHGAPGYREPGADDADLGRGFAGTGNAGLLLDWYRANRDDDFESWPTVLYYLMGANEWRAADTWPPPDTQPLSLYLDAGGLLSAQAPSSGSGPDRYVYDPDDPTPTAGGSIVSLVYEPGSVDVSGIQARPDVLGYSTPPLEQAVDVVGPLRLVLYASSSAVDTDFAARLTDVFPNGRAIQLQNGVLRARYRDPGGNVSPLEPGCVYRLEIDMWSTANRFEAGHRIRLDISSADFPRFDRNNNRGEPGPAVRAEQAVYHDTDHPSQLLIHVVA
jgi:predicted acyl esterase